MDQSSQEYDTIADAYKESKQLPFRQYVEEYTLFKELGDIRGKRVIDLACGEGFFTRKIKRAGAATVIGVDISGEMIRLAEEEEKRHPLGLRYVHRDAAQLESEQPVDVVSALYLFNYARTKEELVAFSRAAYRVLGVGGRLVGLNDNVKNPPRGRQSFFKYGFERESPKDCREGDPIRYRFTGAGGEEFEFTNFYLRPATYEEAFQEAGFADFQWVDPSLHPSQRGEAFWDDFLENPPIICLAAQK